MTSIATPFGLRPVGKLDQGSLEPVRHFPIASGYATNIAAGDVVHLVDNTNVVTIEKQAGTGSGGAIDMLGIFVGCTYTDPTLGYVLHSTMWPASTVAADAMAYVVCDPDVLFEIQASAAIPTNARIIYGKNAAFVQTAPSVAFKASRVTLDVTTLATTATHPVRIIDYRGGDQGAEKGSAFPILVCKFNYTQLTTTTGSA